MQSFRISINRFLIPCNNNNQVEIVKSRPRETLNLITLSSMRKARESTGLTSNKSKRSRGKTARFADLNLTQDARAFCPHGNKYKANGKDSKITKELEKNPLYQKSAKSKKIKEKLVKATQIDQKEVCTDQSESTPCDWTANELREKHRIGDLELSCHFGIDENRPIHPLAKQAKEALIRENQRVRAEAREANKNFDVQASVQKFWQEQRAQISAIREEAEKQKQSVKQNLLESSSIGSANHAKITPETIKAKNAVKNEEAVDPGIFYPTRENRGFLLDDLEDDDLSTPLTIRLADQSLVRSQDLRRGVTPFGPKGQVGDTLSKGSDGFCTPRAGSDATQSFLFFDQRGPNESCATTATIATAIDRALIIDPVFARDDSVRHYCYERPVDDKPDISFLRETLPPGSILNQPVASIIDTYLPPLTMSFSIQPGESCPPDLEAGEHHGFSSKIRAPDVQLDSRFEGCAFGITKESLVRNTVKLHDIIIPPPGKEVCREQLSELPTPQDFMYIVQNKFKNKTGGRVCGTAFFTAHMEGYKLKRVTRTECIQFRREQQKWAESQLRLKKSAKTIKIEKECNLTAKNSPNFPEDQGADIENLLSPVKDNVANSQAESKLHTDVHNQDSSIKTKGYGWRRLHSQTISEEDFKIENSPMSMISILTTPRASPRLVGIADPVKDIDYTVDESQFILPAKTEFISDIRGLDLGEKYKSETASGQKVPESTDLATDAFLQVRKLVLQGFGKDRIQDVMDNPISHEAFFDVDKKDLNGNTLFILSCQRGNKQLAKFFLKRGANINEQNHGGNTALHFLFKYSYDDLARYLIDRLGANDQLCDADGRTCYETLIENEYEDSSNAGKINDNAEF